MGKKGKLNYVLFTVIMTVVFLLITEFVIWGAGGSILYDAITNYPLGSKVIGQAILAVLVLIVMLLFRNSYVFTQERQKFGTGLLYGLFYILFGIVITILFGLVSDAFKNPKAVLNLGIMCFLIGMCEEFLCRGWLLNEFLEKFGKSKKGVWYSIIISGLIFGLMHIMNVGAGQSIPSTIIQVMGAAATGIVFGVIYYKTKNIWAVVFLHAFWDFASLLNMIAPVYDKAEVTTNITIVGMVFTILMTMAELIVVIPHIKNIDAKPKTGLVVGLSCVAFVLYIAFFLVNAVFTVNTGTVYKYESINIEQYATTYDNYDEYYINQSQFAFKLAKNEQNNLVITNLNSNYSIELECHDLVDYMIMEQEDQYIIAFVDFVDTSNSYLKYKYIPIVTLSNNNSFLDSIKANLNKYLLPDAMVLGIISDRANNTSYLAGYNKDYGYYILTSENQVSILNRD